MNMKGRKIGLHLNVISDQIYGDIDKTCLDERENERCFDLERERGKVRKGSEREIGSNGVMYKRT